MGTTAGSLLVVDDSNDFRSLYTLWLGEEYEVRTAVNGVDALAELDETIDVVVLDREMPRKDGIAVAREVAAGEFDPAVVMVSGVVPDEELLDIPVDDYLEKPVTRDDIRSAVSRGMDLTECPPSIRRSLALETRLDIARESPETTDPAGSETYRQAAASLRGAGAESSTDAPNCVAAADCPRKSL